MRKLALLLAAALLVSAPLVVSTTTDTYAAAKAKAKAKPKAGGEAAAVDPAEANSRFARALADLGASFSGPRPVADKGGGNGKQKVAKRKAKGKKAM